MIQLDILQLIIFGGVCFIVGFFGFVILDNLDNRTEGK